MVWIWNARDGAFRRTAGSLAAGGPWAGLPLAGFLWLEPPRRVAPTLEAQRTGPGVVCGLERRAAHGDVAFHAGPLSRLHGRSLCRASGARRAARSDHTVGSAGLPSRFRRVRRNWSYWSAWTTRRGRPTVRPCGTLPGFSARRRFPARGRRHPWSRDRSRRGGADAQTQAHRALPRHRQRGARRAARRHDRLPSFPQDPSDQAQQRPQSGQPVTVLAFYRCGEQIYLGGINGRRIDRPGFPR